MFGILVSFSDDPFSGAMLVSGRVIPKKYRQLSLAKIERSQGIRYPQRGRRDISGPLRSWVPEVDSLKNPYGIKNWQPTYSKWWSVGLPGLCVDFVLFGYYMSYVFP